MSKEEMKFRGLLAGESVLVDWRGPYLVCAAYLEKRKREARELLDARAPFASASPFDVEREQVEDGEGFFSWFFFAAQFE